MPFDTSDGSPSAVQLSQRSASPGTSTAATVRWECHPPPTTNLFLEYIPGRDVLYSQQQLAAGNIRDSC
jgi:hypothetical protein